MGLRMENFNILGDHWKIRLLAGGGSPRKTDIEGGLPKKGGLGQFTGLRRELGKKKRVVFFKQVYTPIHTMNQTVKCAQLIEYNTINIFLGKQCTKCDEEASPRPFHKKSKLDQHSEMLYSFFLLYN